MTQSDNTVTCSVVYQNKALCKISAQYVRACRRKLRKMCISYILSSKRGITPSKIDVKWRHLNLLCSLLKQRHVQNFSSICQSMQEKSKIEVPRDVKTAENVYFLYPKSQKRHNSFKNWRKETTLELDLWYIKTKSCAKFHLNMSEHVKENCGKLCISSILSSKRGLTPYKIDAKWRHSNLLCSTLKK